MPTEIVCSRCQREIPPFYPPVTLRDYFAGQAFAGMCSGQIWPAEVDGHEMARRAYLFADAMLAERAK